MSKYIVLLSCAVVLALTLGACGSAPTPTPVPASGGFDVSQYEAFMKERGQTRPQAQAVPP